VRVAIVGYAFTGAPQSQAWRAVVRVFGLTVEAEMRVMCDRNEALPFEELGFATQPGVAGAG
jgi:hypothetical protein